MRPMNRELMFATSNLIPILAAKRERSNFSPALLVYSRSLLWNTTEWLMLHFLYPFAIL